MINDSEICIRQLELAEDVLNRDPHYSEAKLIGTNHCNYEQKLKIEERNEMSLHIESELLNFQATTGMNCDQKSYDAQKLDGSVFVPIDGPNPCESSINLENSMKSGPKRKENSSMLFVHDFPEEITLPDDDMKRPQRKPKPVHFYSQELLKQGIEYSLQPAKPAPGRKKQPKFGPFALCPGAQPCNKPCAVCFKQIKLASYLSCYK
jgi:hypothetical protein